MPFNASGEWVPEDDGVATRVAAITNSGSKIMTQAAATGMAAANRRGLGNSSIGIGAAQGEVLRVATPIASQEAQQVAQKNLQFMQDKTQRGINQQNLDAAERERQAAAITTLTGNTQQAMTGTLANHEIPAATRAAMQASIRDYQSAALAAIQRLYGSNIGWGT